MDLKNYKWNCIVAYDKEMGIGKTTTNDMAWSLPEDLRNFKEKTTGNIIVMGRKTFNSLKKPLPNRYNVVLSKNYTEVYYPDGKVNHIPEALKPSDLNELFNYNDLKDKSVWVIGGGQIYELLLPYCDTIWATEVQNKFGCDVFFPHIDLSVWNISGMSDMKFSSKQRLQYCYVEYGRMNY